MCCAPHSLPFWQWLRSRERGAFSSVVGGPQIARARADGAHHRMALGTERGSRAEGSTQSWVSRAWGS